MITGKQACAAALVVATVFAVPASEAEARAKRCRDVAVEPRSDNGLFDVSASNLSCAEARRTLFEWGRNDYDPSSGPTGFACRVVRRSVTQRARMTCASTVSGQRQRMSFTTGL